MTTQIPIPTKPVNRSMKGLKVTLVALLLIAPPVYLVFRPQDYTPLVDVMFSIFLFLLAYALGHDAEIEKARQEASEKWLPQAEAVTYRLLTLYGNVQSFTAKMKKTCTESSCDLPELQNAEMKAVRVKMKADCNAASDRLQDIANQLEDAIGDWQRFIAENCRGEECGRIFEAFEQRRARIMEVPQEIKEVELV